jgi:hypothetical protein
MLDREAALAAAAAFLEENSRDLSADEAVRTMPESAFVDGSYLIVPYSAVAALDGGVEEAKLGGNMPIRVDTLTGECDWLDINEVAAYWRRGFDL